VTNVRGGIPGLIDALRAVHAGGARSVLGIVFATTGSTYQKPGAMMVLDEHGLRYGVISGGCLEPEVEECARDVLRNDRAASVDFDMRTDEDVTFGSGTGCHGRVRVLLSPQRDGAPLTEALLSLANGEEALSLSLVCSGENTGAGRASLGKTQWNWNRDGSTASVPIDGAIQLQIEPPPRLLLLGAGAESVPLQEFVRRLGWRSVCVEHRGRWLDFARRAEVDQIIEQPPQAAADAWRSLRIDAAVAMSHNYAMDSTNLGLLAASDIGYIGLLGPASRRDQLLDDLGADVAARLRDRLHAPVGLHLGGSGPEVLALSIASELQRYFAERMR
jgi:xanthine dehydrogenase accessory factor